MESILFLAIGLSAGLLAGAAAGDGGLRMIGDGITGSFLAVITGALAQRVGLESTSAIVAATLLAASASMVLLLFVCTGRTRRFAECSSQ
jgi:uncharacterized membrane protein YeaQ/YmgE (transglycosylase-associated protein family)